MTDSEILARARDIANRAGLALYVDGQRDMSVNPTVDAPSQYGTITNLTVNIRVVSPDDPLAFIELPQGVSDTLGDELGTLRDATSGWERRDQGPKRIRLSFCVGGLQ